jgi:hypothetical protein
MFRITLFFKLLILLLITACGVSVDSDSKKSRKGKNAKLSASLSADKIKLDSFEHIDSPYRMLSWGKLFLLQNKTILSIDTTTKKVALLDPQANNGKGKRTILADLDRAFWNPAIVQLSDDRIVILGNHTNGFREIVSVYDPHANEGKGESKALTGLNLGRSHASATLLPSGKILVAGGRVGSTLQAGVELYDVDANSGEGGSTTLTSLPTTMSNHSSVLLSDGTVVFINQAGATTIAHRYDPAGAGSVVQYHSSVLPHNRVNGNVLGMSDDRIVFFGGQNAGVDLATIHVFDPLAGAGATQLQTVSLPKAINAAYAMELNSSEFILIEGAAQTTSMYWHDYNKRSMFVYNLNSNNGDGAVKTLIDYKFPRKTDFGGTGIARNNKTRGFSLLKLSESVVALGGGGAVSPYLEVYDLSQNDGEGALIAPNDFLLVDSPLTSYEMLNYLPNGNILIAGGWDNEKDESHGKVYLINPVEKTVKQMNSLKVPRATYSYEQHSYALPNGKVLFLGGYDTGWNIFDNVELYDPSANDGEGGSVVLTPLSTARASYTAQVLADGRVVLFGGVDVDWSSLDSVEIYDPSGAGSSQVLTSLAGMSTGGSLLGSILMPTGKILVFGGQDINWDGLSGVALYDINGADGAGSVIAIGNLSEVKYGASVQLIADSKVVIGMGSNRLFSSDGVVKMDLIDVDAETNKITPLSSYPLAIGWGVNSAKLDNENILFFGGTDNYTRKTGAYIYNLSSDSFQEIAMDLPGINISDSKIFTMNDGRVLYFNLWDNLNSSQDGWSIFSPKPKVQVSAAGGKAGYKYSVLQGEGTIDSDGVFTPQTAGDVIIRVFDAKGSLVDLNLTVESNFL